MKKSSKIICLGVFLFILWVLIGFFGGSLHRIPYVPSIISLLLLGAICSFGYGLFYYKKGHSPFSSLKKKDNKKSSYSVKDYVYEIALLASEKKLSDADKLIEEAKKSFPNSKEQFDHAKKVGIKSQNVSFSFSVNCPKCGTTITVFN